MNGIEKLQFNHMQILYVLNLVLKIVFMKMDGKIPSRNFSGGNFPWGIFQGEFDRWEFSGWEFS